MIKLKNILCILFSFWFIYSFAQSPEIDSLENLLKDHITEDTFRVNLLNDIANKSYTIDPEKTLRYAKEAGDLSDLLKYTRGKANSLRLLGIYYRKKSDLTKALEYYKSAQKVYEELAESTNETFVQEGKKGVASCMDNIGVIYRNQSNYAKALEYHQASLKLNKTLGDMTSIAKCHINIGIIYRYQGDYPRALQEYHNALQFEKVGGDKYLISRAYNGIGNIYESQSDYSQALDYYQKALSIFVELDKSNAISISYNNLGTVYYKQQNYPKALEYYNAALQLFEKANRETARASVLINIGNIYLSQEKYLMALDNFKESLRIYKNINYQYGLHLAYYNIGDVYYKTQQYPKALYYSLKAYEIAEKLDFLIDLKDANGQLSKIYAATNNYKKAYEHHLAYKQLNDSIFNDENTKKITGLEYQYKFEKEKQAIELAQQKKDAVQAEKTKRQLILRNAFIVGFLLMSFLAVVVFRSLFYKRKANRILTKQKEEIAAQRDEIQSQMEEIHAVNDKLIELDQYKEGMTGMIVHDMKNPLNTILGLSTDEKITQAGNQMLTMVTNILDIQKFESASFQLKQETAELNSILINVLERTSLLYERKSIKIINPFTANYFISVDVEVISRVFVNIISNAVKYTPNNGEIKFEVDLGKPEWIKIKVTDTGDGIPENMKQKIFNKFSQYDARESGKTASTGLGLAFCKLAVEAHEGEIGVESEIGKGSTFWFTLPLLKIEEIEKNNIAEQRAISNKSLIKSDYTEAELAYLQGVAKRLKPYSVFEFSDIIKILNEINTTSNNIVNWKNQLENAVRACNEEKYKELTNL
jgi:signal transduction histidine kinase/Tfp pilus assembly protein PilF